MSRLFYAFLIGLVGAGIVHVTILLLLPLYSVHDAWSRFSAIAQPYATVPLEKGALAGIAPVPADPYLEAAICRFDLADGMLQVQGDGSVPFWSMSIFDSNGLNAFSINQRSTNDRRLDFILASPSQMQRLRGMPMTGFGQSVFVEADVSEGIILVRTFVPDDSWQDLTRAFLQSIDCEPMRTR